MKKTLKKLNRNGSELYFYENGIKKVIDYKNKSTYPPNIRGDISELRGCISRLWGEINSELRGEINSRLWGDISGLRGEINGELRGCISGLRGDCTTIYGNIDECKLTEEERAKTVDIQELIE